MCKTIFRYAGCLVNAKPWPRRVAQLKTISGIFVELAGCLLTQNELISPRGALSAQSVHDIRLATQREMGWWRDRPQQRAGWLTHRLLPLQSGLSPLLPVAHYLNQTLDFRPESVLLAWETKMHRPTQLKMKNLVLLKSQNQWYSWVHVCICVSMCMWLCLMFVWGLL